MITLYGMGSPNVMKIFIALEEMELAYRVQPVDLLAGEQFSPEFLALNPTGKVPVIVDDDSFDGESLAIFESGAILKYLAGTFGGFFPVEPRARLVAEQWLLVQLTGIGPMFGQYFHFRNYAEGEHAYARSRYTTHCVRLCEIIDRRLTQSRFIGSDEYSIVDMATFPWLRNIATYFEEAEERYPHVLAWAAEIGARPAVVRAIAKTFEAQAPLTGIETAPSEQRDRFFGRGKFAAR